MPMMRAAVLANFPQVARELGLDPLAMLREADLPATLLENPDRLMSGDALVRLLERSAQLSGCADFGLRLAQRRQFAEFGVVGLLLRQQPSIRDVLQISLQYIHLLNDAASLHLEESPQRAVLRLDILTDKVAPGRQVAELYVAASVQLLRTIAGNPWRPLAVHFRHAAPASQALHHRLFQCRCEFGSAFNGVVMPASDLDRLNPHADPVMADYARHLIDRLPGHGPRAELAELKRHLYILLPVGRATLPQVAQARGVSVRSLQRQLQLTGESFSGLLCAVRCELVAQYLGNPQLEIGQVAGLLGFSRHASFTRWFIQQYGCPPQQWRRMQQAAP